MPTTYTSGGKHRRSTAFSGDKALAPCLTLVNKGDKGLPFKCIYKVHLRMQSHQLIFKEVIMEKLLDRYNIYLACADDGNGGDITRGGAPLLTFEEWLNA